LTRKHAVREFPAAFVLCSICYLLPAAALAKEPLLAIKLFDAKASEAPISDVVSGSLDDGFKPAGGKNLPKGAVFWLKLDSAGSSEGAGTPVIVMHAGWSTRAELFAERGGTAAALPRATQLPGFRGSEDTVFTLVEGLGANQPLYARVSVANGDSEPLSFTRSTLEETLARGAERARMIALTFGALVAMALAALLIWFVLREPLFILYATLFFLHALYVVYLSGQGFDWPWLSHARSLGSFAWNVPVGLSGAVACLFTREIADLRHFSPRIYAMFGWFAAAFVLITVANLAKLAGLGILVNALGNLMFSVTAAITLVVAFVAWRRGNRAAGWFLIAWALLEGFTMTAAVRFLITRSVDSNPLLYHYGLPLSMVAAAVLVALGVADRLRAQRLALTEAERRAQTDPLTGVLNRRSLIERLDAACLRARARGLPISLLFIDLDHFKEINDSFGHPAGDACLRAIIEPIHAELRQSDVIGRYGGEEFVVILSSADAAAANPIANRILQRVSAISVEGFGAPIRLTCSIGVAASDTLGLWGEHLIAQADAAVYVAKRMGRNQVRMAAPIIV
jgi:two-component system, sensor histidine kinase LadS